MVCVLPRKLPSKYAVGFSRWTLVCVINQATTGIRWLIGGQTRFPYIGYLIGPRRTFENGLYRDSRYRDTDWAFSLQSVAMLCAIASGIVLLFKYTITGCIISRIAEFDNPMINPWLVNEEFIPKSASAWKMILKMRSFMSKTFREGKVKSLSLHVLKLNYRKFKFLSFSGVFNFTKVLMTIKVK